MPAMVSIMMVPTMIESFVPGRVRLRSRLLSEPRTAELLKRALLEIQGVRSVAINERTGGLLLEYDAGSLPLPVLMKAMPLFDRLQALEEKTGDVLQDVDAVLRELKSLLEGE